jgi:hypothetical protein
MSNRRRYERQLCLELTNINTETRRDRVGLVRDLSPTGVRFDSISKFAVNERVELLIDPPSLGRKILSGRVVRAFAATDATSLYPHSAAVEFDTPRFDLGEASPPAH